MYTFVCQGGDPREEHHIYISLYSLGLDLWKWNLVVALKFLESGVSTLL